MQGGPSHIDLFDPKPELARRSGKTFTGEIKYDNAGEASSEAVRQPLEVPQARRVRHGAERAAAVPGRGRRRLITLVRSMQTGVNNHGQSITP